MKGDRYSLEHVEVFELAVAGMIDEESCGDMMVTAMTRVNTYVMKINENYCKWTKSVANIG